MAEITASGTAEAMTGFRSDEDAVGSVVTNKGGPVGPPSWLKTIRMDQKLIATPRDSVLFSSLKPHAP